MLNFDPVSKEEITIDQLCAMLTVADLRQLTDEMIDAMLDLIAGCTDADVTFVPDDPRAEDTFATDPDEASLAWTLGHVIVHATASSEEAAFLAAELGRGVPAREDRSRYEVPWRTMTTTEQCRLRLEESRRMRVASLELWPDPPHLDNTFKAWYGDQRYNADRTFRVRPTTRRQPPGTDCGDRAAGESGEMMRWCSSSVV